MPRNGSGSFSVASTFTSGTTISSSTMNSVLEDIGSELTNSVAKDGQSTMTGQLKAASGTVSAPGIAFGSDTGTGIRRSASGTMKVVVSGADVATIDSGGLTMESGYTIEDQAGVTVTGVPTGAMMMYGATSAPTGWVRMNGRTIGNASSAATERANADTSALFTFLWTNYSDSVCAVSTGRGASASADYAANKTIALPSMRGRAPFGLDDMGNSAAGVLGTIITSSTTNGASGGTETVTLDTTQIPSHTHGAGSFAADSNGAHTHNYGTSNPLDAGAGASASIAGGGTASTTSSNGAHTHTISGTSGSTGGGLAHSNMPPAFLTTFIIKL
jgi:microcystin-dependent protein